MTKSKFCELTRQQHYARTNNEDTMKDVIYITCAITLCVSSIISTVCAVYVAKKYESPSYGYVLESIESNTSRTQDNTSRTQEEVSEFHKSYSSESYEMSKLQNSLKEIQKKLDSIYYHSL